MLHNPPTVPGSWWAEVKQDARDGLTALRERIASGGRRAFLQTLTGRYSDVRKYTKPGSDRVAEGNVPPGEVVECLRLYAKLDDATMPGRVLYRTA